MSLLCVYNDRAVTGLFFPAELDLTHPLAQGYTDVQWLFIRLLAFVKEVAGENDGALDQTRYPMCADRPSLDPDLPSPDAQT